MSYDYRYQRTTTNRPGARRRYAPPPPPSRGSSSHHSVLGYWMPLVVTGTLALGGLAAWIWSERSEHDEDDYPHEKPPRPQAGVGQNYPTQGSQPYPGPPPQQGGSFQGPPPQNQGPVGPPRPGGEASSYYNTTITTTESRDVNVQQSQSQQDDGTWYGRMSGMVKRTPSPQQFFDSATKQVTAGMAAAGAALGSIMEDSDEQGDRSQTKRRTERRETKEEREGFSDHERWSEEADEKQRVSAVETESERRADNARSLRDEKGKGRAKRAVAVIVSADTNTDVYAEEEHAEYRNEHASILSHLPTVHNSDSTDLFVLIYAPGLKSLPPLNYQPNTGTGVASSIGSQMNTPAVTPGSELQSISPRIDPIDSGNQQFDALYTQALSLVSSPTQILPFTTPDGYVHILRHLAPQLVYVSDVLSGDEGESVAQLKGWVGHTILVAGDDGVGGLADTETETEAEDDGGGRREKKAKQWYEDSTLVGLGKEVEVVDAVRVGEDWNRRVGGRQ